MAAPTGKIKDFDSLRNILRGARKEDGSVDLYQHLVEVVNHIVMHCPDKGLDQFEEISYLIKHKDNFKMEEFLRIHEADNYNTPSAAFKESVEKYAALAKKHFEVSQAKIFIFNIF